jgi:hypothetical protein
MSKKTLLKYSIPILITVVIMGGSIILTNKIKNDRRLPQKRFQSLLNQWSGTKDVTFAPQNKTADITATTWKFQTSTTPRRTYTIHQYTDKNLDPYDIAAASLAAMRKRPNHQIIHIAQNPGFAVLKTEKNTRELTIWKVAAINGTTWANGLTIDCTEEHHDAILSQNLNLIKKFEQSPLLRPPKQSES